MFEIIASDSNLVKFTFTLVVLIVTYVISLIIKKSIDLIFGKVKRSVFKTVWSLLKNTIDFILLFIAVMVILSNWGVDIGPIITGAGILGLAFSFGAQTLVKDLIVGFFIITENQFNIGDRVKIGNHEGEVYNMTLRMTVLKDKDENLIYIPNSQITTVVKMK